METPTIQYNGGIFLIEWTTDQIRIRVDRLRTHHNATTGEITVFLMQPTSPGILHQARLNLSSTTARNQLIKTLYQRWDAAEWEHLIEAVCLKVLQRLREGEPLIKLNELPLESPIYSTLWPFLLESQPTLLYGFGGTGKSLFGAYVAVLTAHGTEDARTGLNSVQRTVLYLDWETTAHEVRERIHGIEQGLSLSHSPAILYRRCHQKLADEIEDIQRLTLEHQIGLLIIDSVGLACGGELKETESTIDYYRALRTLGLTSLSLDHKAKNQEGKEHSPYGSVYKINLSRSVWEIRHTPDANEHQMSLGFFHRKVNRGRLCKPLGFRVEFAEGLILWHKQDIHDVPDLSEGLSIRERLDDFLKQGSQEVEVIAEQLALQPDVIRMTLNRYKDKQFMKLGDKWGLISHANQ